MREAIASGFRSLQNNALMIITVTTRPFRSLSTGGNVMQSSGQTREREGRGGGGGARMERAGGTEKEKRKGEGGGGGGRRDARERRRSGWGR